ncbi:MAG: FkbM family methyltransferase [Candidatus Asgardarchaeia archaeon]
MYDELKNVYRDTRVVDPSPIISNDDFVIVSDDGFLKKMNLYEESMGFVWDNRKDYETVCCIYAEIFEQENYSYNQCKVEKGDIVVDIGANVGIFSRYAYMNGGREIFSFEPEIKSFYCLERNQSSNQKVYNFGFSNENKVSFLNIDKYTGGHTILNNDTNNTKTGETQIIGCISLNYFLDNIKSHIDFLKIDAEGSELDIFKGISDHNLLKINKICMEYHNFMFYFDKSRRDQLLNRFLSSGFHTHALFLGANNHIQMLYMWR